MTATRRNLLKTGLAASTFTAAGMPHRAQAYRANVKGFIGMPEIVPFRNVEKA